MNPFAQLIVPVAMTSKRLAATVAVVTVREGVRLVPPGAGRARKLPGRLAELPVLDDAERAEAEELKKQLARESELRWRRDRYARRKKDPAFLAVKRARERRRYEDPAQRRRIKKWERDNAERLRAYKTQWAQLKRLQETPEQREARRAAQREKERAYYAANREVIQAKARARRAGKKAVKRAEKGAGAQGGAV